MLKNNHLLFSKNAKTPGLWESCHRPGAFCLHICTELANPAASLLQGILQPCARVLLFAPDVCTDAVKVRALHTGLEKRLGQRFTDVRIRVSEQLEHAEAVRLAVDKAHEFFLKNQ